MKYAHSVACKAMGNSFDITCPACFYANNPPPRLTTVVVHSLHTQQAVGQAVLTTSAVRKFGIGRFFACNVLSKSDCERLKLSNNDLVYITEL